MEVNIIVRNATDKRRHRICAHYFDRDGSYAQNVRGFVSLNDLKDLVDEINLVIEEEESKNGN